MRGALCMRLIASYIIQLFCECFQSCCDDVAYPGRLPSLPLLKVWASFKNSLVCTRWRISICGLCYRKLSLSDRSPFILPQGVKRNLRTSSLSWQPAFKWIFSICRDYRWQIRACNQIIQLFRAHCPRATSQIQPLIPDDAIVTSVLESLILYAMAKKDSKTSTTQSIWLSLEWASERVREFIFAEWVW